MADIEKKAGKVRLEPVRDTDIVASPSGRRRFLSMVGIGSTALISTVLASGCSKSDRCDTDTQTDIDSGSRGDASNRKKDRCDSDGV